MSKIKKKLREEKGSMTLEFLMVMPYYFFFFLLLWQAVASGITFMNAQSAVNQAAKTYAVTGDERKAHDVAEDAIGYSDIMSFDSFDIPPHGSSKEFVAEIKVNHGIVFLPKKWRDNIPFDIDLNVTSRMIK